MSKIKTPPYELPEQPPVPFLAQAKLYATVFMYLHILFSKK